MSDLATILDLQGHHGDALLLIQQAVDLGRSVGHPDQHVLLGNLAGVLLHTGELSQVSLQVSALSLHVCSLRTPRRVASGLQGGSESGSAVRGPGGRGPGPGGAEGGEEEEEPGEGGEGGEAC